MNQIEEAQLQENEDKELEEEQVLLEHAEDIKQALFQASTAINSEELSVLNQLKDCCDTLNGIADNFPTAKELSDRIDSCYIELKDIADVGIMPDEYENEFFYTYFQVQYLLK